MLLYLDGRLSIENEEKARRCAEDCIPRPCLPFCQTTGLESLAEVEGSSNGGTEEEIEAEHGEKGKPARWCLEQSSSDAVQAGLDEVAVHSGPELEHIAAGTLGTDDTHLISKHRAAHTEEHLRHVSLGLELQDLSPGRTVCGAHQDSSRRIGDRALAKLDNDMVSATGRTLLPAIFEMMEMKWCLNTSFPNDKQPFVVARIGRQEIGSSV